MTVLITGISSKLGKLVAKELLARDHEVVGIDRRPWSDAPDGVEVVQTDIRKRPAENVFRTRRPKAVVHMATVTHLMQRSADRFRVNLQGTRAVVQHCDKYGVGQLVFVGRHTYYGAAADSPLYHTEEEPPMGLASFPELADLVAADLYAGSALWRFPKLSTAVLRVCYVLGPSKHGTLAAYIRGPRVPTVLGFDPLFQFIHEVDAARAIASSVEAKLRGVFNVSGPPPTPLSVVIEQTGRTQVAVPAVAVNLMLGRFGLPRLPRGAIDHIKYPIVIESEPFREASGFVHKYDEDQTMRDFRDER